MLSLRHRILFTLAYHSIFDYPLTIEEIHHYLIARETVSLKAVEKEANNLSKTKKAYSHNGFFLPSSSRLPSGWSRQATGGQVVPRISSLVLLRLRRQKISTGKMIIAKRASRVISMIPWVKMVAVTGALAMENADKNDDIDLMVVTSKNRLWLVRPLVILLVSLFFKRRKPSKFSNHSNHSNHFSYKNHICLNLWLDESALEIPENQRDLYTAHELAQMKPVVNRDGIYERMMWENRWGRKYLVNVWKDLNHSNHFNHFNHSSLLNLLAFNLQFQFMKSKMTNERVSLHTAFFHPGNRADTILKAYDRLCHRSF